MVLITPPEAMPIRRIQWRLRQPHQINRSGWTGRRQVSTQPGAAMWSCSAEFRTIHRQSAAKKWRAFFASLNGQVNHFPVIAVEEAQHGGGNPTIVSGAADANTLSLSASPPALQYGDMMTVKLADGSWQLVQLTAPIAGTTATFMPPLRANAATGAGGVETVLPFCHVALSEDVYEFAVEQGQEYHFSFDAEEAF